MNDKSTQLIQELYEEYGIKRIDNGGLIKTDKVIFVGGAM